MKRQPRILAGTAIGLLMASAPLGAFPLQGAAANNSSQYAPAPVILAQADCEPGAEGCPPEGKPRKQKHQAEEQQAQPQAEQAAEPEQKPLKQKRQAEEQQAEPSQAEQAAPAAEPEQKPRKRKQQAEEQQAEPSQAEQAAEPEQKQQKRQAEKQKTAPAQAEEQAGQAGEPKGGKEKLRKFLNKQEGGQDQSEPQQAEQPSSEEQPKQAEKAKPGQEAQPEQPAQAEQAPAEGEKPAQQAGEPKSKKDKLRQYLNKKQKGGVEQAEPQQAEQPAPEGQPQQAEKAKPGEEQSAPEQNAGEPAEQAKGGKQQAEGGKQEATKPVLPGNLKAGKQRRQERVKENAEATPLPENAAPVFDSAKRGQTAGEQTGGQAGQQQAEQPSAEQQQNGQAAEAPPPPASDAAAQEAKIAPDDIKSLLVEQGERFNPDSREERRRFRRERREQRDDVQVVKEYNDNRTIVEVNNRIFIESPDNDRIILRNDEVYYDELPRGRTREVITRPNGVKVITVRNRYGDIIRRSRVLPDGNEVLLVYVPDDRLDVVASWEDPAADLPPLQLTVPVSSYILEADTVEDSDRYYEFFEQPPIAEIPRIYSIDEVKRSARLRDTMPRIDLDTINFETGSAEIGESEVDELDAIAQAILKVLQDNPGETFLIEGHTDAVGSDQSNLVLSDRRAESVAQALTSVYEIPPENLVTQGYGEQYLKVQTGGPSRENRRVAMRRITPLVAPVASAQ